MEAVAKAEISAKPDAAQSMQSKPAAQADNVPAAAEDASAAMQ